jgi:hypothetical protein
VSCTKMLSFYLLHASVSVNIIIDVILWSATWIGFCQYYYYCLFCQMELRLKE